MEGIHIKIQTASSRDTFEFGEFLGKHLFPGGVVALIGDLGAGKTQLVKGLAKGLDIPEEYYVTSPTFTIINEYPAGIPLYHFDLYRLEHEEDLEELGYEEYFEGRGVTVIEWAERMIHLLPEERMEIHISSMSENSRKLEIIGYGEHYQGIIDEIIRSFV